MFLNRRQLLRHVSLGAAGTVLSPVFTPFLRQVRAEADGKPSALPRRVVFVIKSSGIEPQTLVPPDIKATGSDQEKLLNVSLRNKKLPESLAALEPLKDQVVLLQGLSGRVSRPGHSSWYGRSAVTA